VTTEQNMTVSDLTFGSYAPDVVDAVQLTKLFTLIRAVKTRHEIEIMRLAIKISSAAHIQVMKMVRGGLMEFQLESVFRYMTGVCGMVQQAYPPICGSGTNSAVLHYEQNDRQLVRNTQNRISSPDMFLIDAGGELLGYASDITRTYPNSGKFSPQQKAIYEAVLRIQESCIAMLKPGVDFALVQLHAKKRIIIELQQLGFIKSEYDVDHLLELKINTLFMPHGLGHLMGLDVHDTSVYPIEPLQENMIITIEPGIYFGKSQLSDQALNKSGLSQYLNMPMIKQYVQFFGGVRIEDDILITASGYEILSVLPKKITEVEALLISA
jgi:Xaa-Pro dipeptidase